MQAIIRLFHMFNPSLLESRRTRRQTDTHSIGIAFCCYCSEASLMAFIQISTNGNGNANAAV